MNNYVVIVILTVLGLTFGQLNHRQDLSFSIPNVTKVNIENRHFVIAANAFGEIQIQESTKKNVSSRVITGFHSSPIILIEQYQHDGREHVIVDQDGTITIWDATFQQQLHNFTINETIKGATIRERQRGVEENRLAINCEDKVIQFSLDNRSEIRTHDYNSTILAIVYTKETLFMTTSSQTILMTNDAGSLIKEIPSPLGNVNLLSIHNHNEWSARTEEVIGVASLPLSSAYLLHIDLNSEITQSTALTSQTVTSLNYCRGRIIQNHRRRPLEDLIILGIQGVVLQVRQGDTVQTWTISQGIVDVFCYQQDLFVLTGKSQLQMRQLDHSEHNGSKSAALAGLIFLVLIVAIAAYQIRKRKINKREKSCQTPPQEFQLQQRMIQQ